MRNPVLRSAFVPLMQAARALPLLALLVLPGCGSFLTEGTADLAGIAGAGAASAVTRNGAAAAAIGLGVRSLAAEGLKYATRSVHRDEQDAIARVAAPLAPGTVAPWSVVHRIPLEDDEQGDLVVTREFGAGSLRCKELVFSVERTRRRQVQPAFYITTVCQVGPRWRWASAEPATERWGGLQ